MKKVLPLIALWLVILPAIAFADVLGQNGQPIAPQQGQGGPNPAQAGTLSGTGGIAQNANAVNAILHPASSGTGSTAVVYLPPQPETSETVRELVMDNSINAYPDICACPYSRNHDGYECGVESAYYRPGGYRIYCFQQDVRGQQLIFYRKTH